MRPLILALLTGVLLWSNGEAYPSANTMGNVLLAYRWITEGSASIAGFAALPARYRDWETTQDLPTYNRFGPGASLALAPVVALGVAAGVPPEDVGTWTYLDKLVASFLIATASLAIFAAAGRLAGEGPAGLATFAVVAGTSLASVAGQRSWQHPLGVLGVALGWLCLVKARDDARWLGVAGLPFAIAVITRYPDAIFWAAALAYVAFTMRRRVVAFLGWSAGPFAFLALYDAVLLGSPVANSYGAQLWQWAGLDGLPGTLISPSRGLFVYSPFLVFAAWTIARRAWRRERLWLYAAVAVTGFWIVHGTYIGWWGGWSFGSRYLLEAMPILASGFALAWAEVRPRWRIIMVATVAFGVMLQVAALLGYYHFWDGYNWDAFRITNADGSAAWDIRDPQWWWVIRSALATGGARWLVALPTALIFGALAFRAALPARPALRPALT